MAVERLADSRAAEEFTSTVLIENIQPGQTLTFEQLIARSEQIAQDTGANDLRTRIFATDFLVGLVQRERAVSPRGGRSSRAPSTRCPRMSRSSARHCAAAARGCGTSSVNARTRWRFSTI